MWFDFVADLGDGFDSTFAVACLLARKEYEVGGKKLPRGQMLIMGGDEVYPLANAQTYRNQLFQPYLWAFPDPDRKDPNGVPLFAIPGNHDWYDGLVQFLAYFTPTRPTHFGGWRTHQKRSYSAIQLTKNRAFRGKSSPSDGMPAGLEDCAPPSPQITEDSTVERRHR